MNPEKSVSEIAKDLWNRLCSMKQARKDKPYILIAEALSVERKKVEDSYRRGYQDAREALLKEYKIQSEKYCENWKSIAERMKGLLEYHSGSKIVQSLFSEYEKFLAEYERMGTQEHKHCGGGVILPPSTCKDRNNHPFTCGCSILYANERMGK